MALTGRGRFKLSPSDLTFLWEDCHRCFYDKCRGRGDRPRLPMPGVFTKIDKAMRGFYGTKGTGWISPTLPPGIVNTQELRLTSDDILVPGCGARCWLSGRTDGVLTFDDDTYGVVDFKTANPGDEAAALYVRQLSAYAYCMEHPGAKSPLLSPVSHMGLLCFEPGKWQMLVDDGPTCLLNGRPIWKPRPWDEAGFLDFLGEVMSVLEPPDPPEPAAGCLFCAYRSLGTAEAA